VIERDNLRCLPSVSAETSRNTTRCLLLNEGQGIHSVYDPNSIQTYGTWDYFTIAPFFNAPPYSPARLQRVAIIGLAAGTIARSYTALFGPLPIDGIEIDPKIVEVGQKYFDMNERNLNIIIGDGRAALAGSPYRYSLIGIDAFRVPYIPWHLTTREYLIEIRQHLTDDGVLVINVGRTRTDYGMVDAMAHTAATVFPSVHVVDVVGSLNSIVFATPQSTSFDNLRANLDAMTQPMLKSVAQQALTHIHAVDPTAVVFTDDNAPVERLTNAIMLNFLFGTNQ
jgi:hypothetical protein